MEVVAVLAAAGILWKGLSSAGAPPSSAQMTVQGTRATPASVSHEAPIRAAWFDSVYFDYPAKYSVKSGLTRGTSYAPVQEFDRVYHTYPYRKWANNPAVRHVPFEPVTYPNRNCFDQSKISTDRAEAMRLTMFNTTPRYVPHYMERASGGNPDRWRRRLPIINNPNSCFTSSDPVIPGAISQLGVRHQY